MKDEATVLMMARQELTGIAKSQAPLPVKKSQAKRLGEDVGKKLQALGMPASVANMLMREVALQVRQEVGGAA